MTKYFGACIMFLLVSLVTMFHARHLLGAPTSATDAPALSCASKLATCQEALKSCPAVTSSNAVPDDRASKQDGPKPQLEVIQVYHADARTVEERIKRLYPELTQGRFTGKARTAPSRNLKGVGIVADERTNSIIVRASKKRMKLIRGIIQSLDFGLDTGENDIGVHVYPCKHARAEDIMKTLEGTARSSTTSGVRMPREKQRATISGGALSVIILKDVRISADKRTNSLIIISSERAYQSILDTLILKLDRSGKRAAK